MPLSFTSFALRALVTFVIGMVIGAYTAVLGALLPNGGLVAIGSGACFALAALGIVYFSRQSRRRAQG